MKDLPDLIEQAQQIAAKAGQHLTREQAQKFLMGVNLMDKYGQPTKWAIEHGMVAKKFTQPHVMSSSQSKLAVLRQQNKGDQDVKTVLSKLSDDDIEWGGEEPRIHTKALKHAIKASLKDGSLTADGRKRWKRVLADINGRKM